MKKLIYLFSLATISASIFTSCDKVEQPVKPVIEIDTTLFTDGNWADYPWPEFPANTNTDRNVLIEDFTGHKCIACPAAAELARQIEDANPGRVFVVSIHAGPNGNNTLQEPATDCGTATNPNNEFCHDFLTDEGTEYSITLGGSEFFANPMGMISRKKYNDALFLQKNSWSTATDDILNTNNLIVNMQAASNFYAGSNGLYLHVQTEFLSDLEGSYNITTYVVDNQIIGTQDSAGVLLEHYHHHNVFLGCIDGQAYGQNVATNPSAGDIFQTDYAYVLPENTTTDSIHFVSYVYDTDNNEILQVIQHNP
ncbi:MAG: Omp28-related outer membrane protein [Putridiphycobacter sp.]